MTSTFVRIFNLYLTIENADYEARPFPVPIYDPSANCTTWENISVRKNELILHILKNREQIETAGRLESKKILASKDKPWQLIIFLYRLISEKCSKYFLNDSQKSGATFSRISAGFSIYITQQKCLKNQLHSFDCHLKTSNHISLKLIS